MTLTFHLRRRVHTLLAAFAAAALTACGSDGSDVGAASASESAAAGYPVSVETTYGAITLENKPERILVIGGDHVDLLASIGEQPAVFAGYGDPDEQTLIGNYPWLDGLYTGEFDPAIVTEGYKADPEVIVGHEPDLIIGTPYYIEQNQYDQLSKIAPTYVPLATPGRTWTDELTELGSLTNKADQAAASISRVEASFADAREQLGGVQGKTVSFADDNAGTLRLMSAGSWIEDLGLVPAANQPAVGSPFVELSLENLDQLVGEIALLVTYDEQSLEALSGDPRFASLPAVKNESLFFVDRQILDAGLGAGPASLAWLLAEIVPLLAGIR